MIEQLGAEAGSAEHYCAVLRTSVRSNTLRHIPDKWFNIIADEPENAMIRFNEWVMSTHWRHSNGDDNPANVILAAHYGSCRDHIQLLKTMIKCHISPPAYLLVDTLAISQSMKGRAEPTSLSALVDKYAPWVDQDPNSVNSDAAALKTVTSIAYSDVKAACYAFSITTKEFIARSGLYMYSPPPQLCTLAYDLSEPEDESEEEVRGCERGLVRDGRRGMGAGLIIGESTDSDSVQRS